MNIGIIGTGNIATFLLEQVNANHQANGRVTAVFGRNTEAGERLEKQYEVEFYTDLQKFLKTPIEVVVEAVTVEAAAIFLKDVIAHNKDLIMSSIGVFRDAAFLDEVKTLAEFHGTQVFLPSGAIGGLDILQSAKALGGLTHVHITTRKSPAALGMETDKEEVLFEGTAYDAVEQFPKNVNVALALAIAGIGIDKTKVRVIVDPEVERNTHTIEAEGDFGRMQLHIENNPMPSNPKTSLLAALSILAVLQNKGNALRFGG